MIINERQKEGPSFERLHTFNVTFESKVRYGIILSLTRENKE